MSGISSASDLSLSFLGAYKKIVRFSELKEYSQKYKVDLNLILAISMIESGGNEDLVSSAEATSLMQVIPRTYRAMKVDNYIEAGVKYFAKQLKHFKRQKKALIAYHGGPSRIRKKRILDSSRQYAKKVLYYYDILKNYKKQIEKEIEDLKIIVLKKVQTWEQLAQIYKSSVIELRLYNSFLAYFDPDIVSQGRTFVYPKKIIKVVENDFYTVRKGDLTPLLRNAFRINIEKLIRPGDKINILAPLQKGD